MKTWTKEQHEKMRALEAKATRGRWELSIRRDDEEHPASVISGAESGRAIAVAMQPRYAHGWTEADGAFIAAIRNAARPMLDEIDRQAKEIAELQATLQAMRDDANPKSMRVVVECDVLDQPIGTCRLTGDHRTIGCLVPSERKGWLILDDLTDADRDALP